jgi:hypothetical protein
MSFLDKGNKMASLMDRMKKNSLDKVVTLDEYKHEKSETETSIPALNVALSGKLNGGLKSGITSIAGNSRHFKTAYGLVMASSYLKKHPDAMMIYYDSEAGASDKYFASFDIDTSRVLHIPIVNIEELTFDLAKKLDKSSEESIKKGEHVFVFIDSIGNLASKREADNAVSENSAADMSRAAKLKSFYRIVTPLINRLDIPLVIVQHIYMEQGMFPRAIMSGGSGGMLSSDTVFIVGKSQNKEGTELKGYNFTLNIEKSRYVREKAKIPIEVSFENGINKYSGILEWALEYGIVKKPKNGWYQLCDMDTGEMIGTNKREADTETEEFLGSVLKNKGFIEFIEKKFSVGQAPVSDEAIDAAMEEVDAV